MDTLVTSLSGLAWSALEWVPLCAMDADGGKTSEEEPATADSISALAAVAADLISCPAWGVGEAAARQLTELLLTR